MSRNRFGNYWNNNTLILLSTFEEIRYIAINTNSIESTSSRILTTYGYLLNIK